jgi:hypothetical protein
VGCIPMISGILVHQLLRNKWSYLEQPLACGAQSLSCSSFALILRLLQLSRIEWDRINQQSSGRRDCFQIPPAL